MQTLSCLYPFKSHSRKFKEILPPYWLYLCNLVIKVRLCHFVEEHSSSFLASSWQFLCVLLEGLLANSFLLQLLFMDETLFLNFPSSPFPSPQPHQLSMFLNDNLMNLAFPIYRCFCCCFGGVFLFVCLFAFSSWKSPKPLSELYFLGL